VPRTCTVCAHQDAVLINEALVVQGQSNRAITRQYALSKDAIRRHREHIPELLLKASQAMEVAEADALLDQVHDLQQHALDILDKAEEAGELRTALAAISQARGNLELLGKLAGELQQEGATNIQIALVEHPDYRRLEELIFRALEHHAQARWDVAEALKELE
jgi:hypothetical protein